MASILFQFLNMVSMKNFLKTKALPIILGLSLSILTNSCVKKNIGPGTGGKAAITGTVAGQDFNSGEYEIQQIIFTPGSEIEHGDYFLLNKVKNANNYYVYFKNPNWVSQADPGIQGRIGIEIVFNYSDSNIEIAAAVKNALANLGNSINFNMSLDQDILNLVYKQRVDIPDPDNGTTNFALDVVNQGSADELSPTVISQAEKRVYLCYGDNEFPDEETRTNHEGEFIFNNLRPGKYKVYVIGMMLGLDQQPVEVAKEVEIIEKESTVNTGQLNIYY